MMTAMEGITFVLAAALAAGTFASRTMVPPAPAMAMPMMAAGGFLLALLQWIMRLS